MSEQPDSSYTDELAVAMADESTDVLPLNDHPNGDQGEEPQ